MFYVSDRTSHSITPPRFGGFVDLGKHALLCSLLLCQSTGLDPQAKALSGQPASTATLRAAGAGAHRLIGVALSARKLSSDPSYARIAATDFDYVTAENEMKVVMLEPVQGRFIWQSQPGNNPAERIVAFAESHGMKVKGHNLLWHKQYPPWMLALDPQALHDAIVNHARQVVRHFKGKVIAWDAANEVIEDGGAHQLRAGDEPESELYLRLGSSDPERRENLYRLVADVFTAAHQEDSKALLFYNDFGIEGTGGKADAAFNLVARLQKDGVPINGVGFQTHIGWNYPAASELAANMKRIAALGLLVNISELDIAECKAPPAQADLLQARQWHDIVAVCVAEPACQAITTWGVDDLNSWRKTCENDPAQLARPLMYDDSFLPKPSRQGMLDALSGR